MLTVISPVSVNDISALQGLTAIGTVLGSAVAPYVAALALLPRASLPMGRDRGFALVLAGALVAIAISYALLNLFTHNLLPRHVIAAAPVGAALFALLLEKQVKVSRLGFGLICANALLVAVAATAYGLIHKRWETNLAPIQAARTACPAARLYALSPMSLLGPDDRLRDVTAIDHVFGLTYRLIVGDAAIVPNGRPIVPQGPCPALLWVEHHYAGAEISDEELARIAGFSGPVRVIRLQRGDARALLAVYGIREALPRQRPGQR
jgi:multisubunit Na+/H+ antiporter MnhE subunit